MPQEYLTLEEQMSVQAAIKHFFDYDIYEYIDHGGEVNPEETWEGWCEFIKINLVNQGKISLRNFNINPNYTVGECKRNYKDYVARLESSEEDDNF